MGVRQRKILYNAVAADNDAVKKILKMKKFNKLILYDLKKNPLEKEFINRLKKVAKSVKVVFAKKEYAKGLKIEDLKGADALVTRLFDFYDPNLFGNSNLKYIGTMHTDVSHFDKKLLKINKITLTNVPDYATEAVAELTISALLNISRQTQKGMNFVKKGYWGFEKFIGWELKGKTLGIVGFGNIGKRVAEIAQCLGMNVIYFSKSRENEKLRIMFKPLKILLKSSDVVSLHCTLNEKTKNIINKSNLKLMKAEAILLDSARSELVDLNALYEKCKNKKLIAWFEAIEDKKTRVKFRKLDNVFLTPHFGWMTKESQIKLKEITLNNINSYLDGKPVNKI